MRYRFIVEIDAHQIPLRGHTGPAPDLSPTDARRLRLDVLRALTFVTFDEDSDPIPGVEILNPSTVDRIVVDGRGED